MAIVTVVGGGLCGSEAAFQLAERGVRVRLFEMKPKKRTPAQTGDGLAELVCSNSFRGAALANAVGLLKEEMRRAGSLIMRCAAETAVPAGGALAVDRERFSAAVTRLVHAHPGIEVIHEEVTEIPEARPVILATGPLTSDALAAALERVVGAERLAYYDAIAPIVSAESIDWTRVFKQSRYDKGEGGAAEGAYGNCPMDKPTYEAFVAALLAAEKVTPRAFEQVRYFEGCLPCEVMAERGARTLAFGPMKPVGLVDPRTGTRPYAVVQLRQEDEAATAYNLVGFQTRMKHADQVRVFRMIPGLENAEFMRLGSVHRNTFLDAPEVLDETLALRALPGVHVAGQLAGVEGYVESAACGMLVAFMLSQQLTGAPVVRPPPTTAFGGLLTHVSRRQPRYQPSNITWACVPPLDVRIKGKRDRYEAMAERALCDLDEWLSTSGLRTPARPAPTPSREPCESTGEL